MGADWLERYRRGDRESVWLELRQLGAAVRSEEHLADAVAVCDEMARRARENVEVLVDRLTAAGYRFHVNDDEKTPVEAFIPASDDAPGLAEWLQTQLGPVPLTVSSWVRIVGDVWLVGTHPEWEQSAAADPLVIEVEGLRWPGGSIRDYFQSELEVWQESQTASDADVFVLPVAPDQLHKDNVSGGGPYGFRLPDASADALFVGEVAMPFVDYLNGVFRAGGFPGGSARLPWRLRSALADGLLKL